MATKEDMKRWETLASRLSMESFNKSEDTIFKNYTAKEKAIFNKLEKSMKGLEKKYLSGPESAAKVRAANKEEKAILSSSTKQFKDLQQTTSRAVNVRKNKVYEDDANVKRYGDDAMRGKGFATTRTQSYAKPTIVDAGASRKPTQKGTKKFGVVQGK